MLVVPFDPRNRNGSCYEHAQIKQGIPSLLDIPEYPHPMISFLHQAVQTPFLYFRNVGLTGGS